MVQSCFQDYKANLLQVVKRPIITCILVIAVFGLVFWLLFGGHSVKLRANGRVVATVKLPAPLRWGDEEYPVYAGETKLFSIWGDFFDCPLCLYAFADGKRFLCVDDDDTSMLVFVVDLRSGSTNLPRSSDWPPNSGSMGSYVRDYMEHRAPQVMIEGSNYVRLPNMEEVQEAASNVDQMSRLTLFPLGDKKWILNNLATNRASVWP